MKSHEDMLDSVAVYALGALPAEEAAAVAEHLRECEECRVEYEFLRPAVTAVAYGSQACATAESGATAISPLVKARIMKQIRSEPASSLRPHVWPAYALAAACLILALLAGAFDIALSSRINAYRFDLAELDRLVADIASSTTARHSFDHGEVLVAGTRLYVATTGLASLPAGKVYQTWTLPRGAKIMEPSVTFVPDGSGTAIVRLPVNAASTAAVAITVEPEGGSKSPTTTPIAIVKLNG
jgi:anti-sigma-K factor RskA